jgi:nitroreductase
MTEFESLRALLKDRYSCRAFRPDPVALADVKRIIDAARHTPSWCNAQPWQVTVTDAPATERFRAALQAEVASVAPKLDLDGPTSYPEIYGERRRACGWQLYEAVGVVKGDRAASGAQMMRNFALFDAPHVAIVSSPRALGAYGAMDSGGFVTAFMLAARALGIDTIAQASVASYADFVRSHFKLPDDRLILCAIAFGYADPEHPANGFRTERAETGEILDWRA